MAVVPEELELDEDEELELEEFEDELELDELDDELELDDVEPPPPQAERASVKSTAPP